MNHVKRGKGIAGRKVIIYIRCSGDHKLWVPFEQVKTGGRMVRGQAGGIVIVTVNT